jgi:hypothetical protein
LIFENNLGCESGDQTGAFDEKSREKKITCKYIPASLLSIYDLSFFFFVSVIPVVSALSALHTTSDGLALPDNV